MGPMQVSARMKLLVVGILLSVLGVARLAAGEAADVILPLDRKAYFIGETVPIAVASPGARVKLEGAHADGTLLLYEGSPGPILLETAKLAPGDYVLHVNGAATDATLTLTSTLRKSAGSMQDEWLPAPEPRMSRQEQRDPKLRAAKTGAYRDGILRTLKESRLTACFAMSARFSSVTKWLLCGKSSRYSQWPIACARAMVWSRDSGR